MEENLFEDDFRETAIKASLQGIKIKEVSDPWDAPFSYCLPTGIPASALAAPNKVLVTCMGPSILCFFLSVICLFFGSSFLPKIGLENIPPIGCFMILFLTGTILGSFGTWYSQKIIRSHLGDRFQKLSGSPEFTDLTYFTIEDAETLQKLKLSPEDMGFLAMDYKNKRLCLEGIRCRYLIHAKHVVDIENQMSAQSKSVIITYQIGKFPFKIAVTAPPQMKLFLSKSGKKTHKELFSRINETLHYEVAESPIFD